YGFARVADEAVRLLPEEERAALNALADGINAFLDSHGGRLGLEFAMLRRAPRRFTAADSLLVLLLMHESLSTSWQKEAALDRVARRQPSLLPFLSSDATADDVPLVPDTDAPPVPLLPEVGPRRLLAEGWAWGPPAAEALEVGSNAWAVSGAL